MTTVESEWRSLCLGKQLGIGQNRDVYEYKFNPNLYVVKEERRGNLYQNILEYRIWQEVQGTEWAKWFAPCFELSANGWYLIQGRVEFPEKKRYPKELPRFFSDTKYRNFGLYKGRFVACDYGFPRILKFEKTKAMKKVNWWQETGN